MRNNGNKPMHPTGHSQSGTGLTKREYFAAMAMQGLATDNGRLMAGKDKLTEAAVNLADALLKELEK